MAKSHTAKNPLGQSNDDRHMILNGNQWPCWPFLPIKRRNHGMKDENFGVLMCDSQYESACKGVGEFVVYHVYLFALPKNKAQWDAAPKTVYKSVDDMLADNWIVD